MKRAALTLVGAPLLALFACSNDFDQFEGVADASDGAPADGAAGDGGKSDARSGDGGSCGACASERQRCSAACTETSERCEDACPGGGGQAFTCRSKCRDDRDDCRRDCTNACIACGGPQCSSQCD